MAAALAGEGLRGAATSVASGSPGPSPLSADFGGSGSGAAGDSSELEALAIKVRSIPVIDPTIDLAIDPVIDPSLIDPSCMICVLPSRCRSGP